MPKGNFPLYSWNAGLVSKLALGRLDVSRMKYAAETMTNWVPYVVGPMQLRPGLEYIHGTASNAATYPIPFVFAHDDKAIIELGNSVMRVVVDDVLVTRNSVDTTVTNGDFSSGTGWTLSNATIANGVLTLSATSAGTRATCKRTLTISGDDQNVEHAIRVTVLRGPCGFRIGSTDGGDELLSVTQLGRGVHSLTFTPTSGSAFLQFESTKRRDIIVDSATIESSGTMTITIPWAAADLDTLDWTQSGDIIYIAAYGYQQRKIERRTTRSWSLVFYEPEDGPFQDTPTDDVLVTASNTQGTVTLTAGSQLFSTDREDSLMRIFSAGQRSTDTFTAENSFTGIIRVSGVGDARKFQYFASSASTYTSTLTLQRSVDSSGSGFADVTQETIPFNKTFDDNLDNTVAWYRLGIKSGDYTSGTLTKVGLEYSGGGDAGIVRLTTVTSSTTAKAEVLTALSSTKSSRDWLFGKWSAKDGFPSAVQLHEGRLWWLGKDKIIGSVSDAYESYEYGSTADSGTVDRSIGFGPIEKIRWGLSLQRLLLGGQSSELSVRANDFGNPITPTNFVIKDASTQGAAQVRPVKVDSKGIFVQQSKRRVYELFYDVNSNDYAARDLTALIPDLDSNIIAMAVQRQPDTRVHCVLADGTVLVLVYEPQEQVICWYKVTTNGSVENVVVLPGDVEDSVYYYVNRTINSGTVRYLEKYSLRSECQGGAMNKQADAFLASTQASSTAIGGLTHLVGSTVEVWANSKYQGTAVVNSSGEIGIAEATTGSVVGLGYTATFKSAKLAYAAGSATALLQPKRISQFGVVLHNTHAHGLKFGKSTADLDDLPVTYKGATISTSTYTYTDAEIPLTPFLGAFDTDSRFVLEAYAPKPCTVIAGVMSLATHDKA